MLLKKFKTGEVFTQQMNDLIIFDVGGVLVKLEFKNMFLKYAQRSGIPQEEIKKKLAESNIEKERNLGNDEEYYQGIRKILKDQTLSDAWINAVVNSSLPEQIEKMVNLKEKLHLAGYEIGILSTNANAAMKLLSKKWPKMLETWGGLALYSQQTRILKPDPKAYEPFTKLAVKRIIFIDDKSAYLKYPCEKLGWIGIHFTKYRDLDEPIRYIKGSHQDEEQIKGAYYQAETEEEVEAILRKLGLKF